MVSDHCIRPCHKKLRKFSQTVLCAGSDDDNEGAAKSRLAAAQMDPQTALSPVGAAHLQNGPITNAPFEHEKSSERTSDMNEDEETGASSNADIEDNNMDNEIDEGRRKWTSGGGGGDGVVASQQPTCQKEIIAGQVGEDDRLVPQMARLSLSNKSRAEGTGPENGVLVDSASSEHADEGTGATSTRRDQYQPQESDNSAAYQTAESEGQRTGAAAAARPVDAQRLKSEWTARTLSR